MNLRDMSVEELEAALAEAEGRPVLQAGDMQGKSTRELEEALVVAEKAEPQGGSIADPLGQGMTFGFSDELAGLGGSVMQMLIPEALGGTSGFHPVDAYTGTRDAARANQQAYAARNPKTALAAEIGGSLLTGGAGGARVAGSKALQNMGGFGRNVAVGAGEGAVEGFGKGEGLAESTLGIGTGGIGGGAVGGAVGTVGKVAEMAANKMPKGRWKQPLRQGVDMAGGTDAVKQRMAEHGKFMVADTSPELRSLTAELSNRQGGRDIAEQAFNKRQREMYDDVVAAGKELSPNDYYGRLEDLKAIKQTRADFDYGMIRDKAVNVTDDMRRAVATTPGQKAMNDAKDYIMTKYQLDEFRPEDMQRFELWDMWKRNMDGLAKSTKNPAEASLIRKIRDPIKDDLNVQTDGLYEVARKSYRELSSLEDAMAEGRLMFRTSRDPEEIIKEIGDMNPDQASAFLDGMVRELNRMAGDMPETANSAWKMIKSPNYRKKLRAAIGDDDKTDAFIKTMRDLSEMNRTNNMALTGSKTASLLNQHADTEKAKNIGGRVLAGDPTVITDLAQSALLQRYGDLSPDEVTQMMQVLTSRGNTLENIISGAAFNSDVVPVVTGAITSAAGDLVY